jgi:hypothetical protein
MNRINTREKEIINNAVQHLENITGFRTRLHYYEQPGRPDAALLMQNEDYQVEFDAEVRLYLNKARLGGIIHQVRGFKRIPLIITEYVNPELIKVFEKNEINFIDAAGNALIKVPPLFVKIIGNKLDKENKAGTTKRTFNTAALQVIFALLCNPHIAFRTKRIIAENAGVALGTVHNTVKKLVEQGYLLNRTFERYKLVNTKELLEQWVTRYPEKLKPKYQIGVYDIAEDQMNKLQLENFNALWGGEEAAARLTNFLRPFIYTIYIGEREGEFILRNRLKKEVRGNLVLMKKFWNFENYNYPGLVHPILIYADLLATGDPRNIETAKIVYEKEIVRYIRED